MTLASYQGCLRYFQAHDFLYCFKRRMMQQLDLQIKEIREVSPAIREFVLVSSNGSALPTFEPGSHLKIQIPTIDDERSYSLVVTDPEYDWTAAPGHYRLGVRLEENGQGGSQFMHQLQVGGEIQAKGPFNDFPLAQSAQDEAENVLIAGGIGITPIASMAQSLKAQGRPFCLHYSARSKEHLAFADELSSLVGDKLYCYSNEDNNFTLPQLFDQLDPSQHLYICGPQSMIDEAIQIAKERQWPSEHVHFELFITAAPQDGDQAFEIELAQSGQVLTVPADKTIVDVLEEAGLDPMYDCRRGECGVCTTDVLSGTPDHRDYYLSDKEKESGKMMQICISRSKSSKLVLDL